MAKTYCDQCNVTHTALMCFYKPRTPIKKKPDLTWEQTRAKWFLANPSPNNVWVCYLMIDPHCPGRLTKAAVVLDHIKPRGSHPELKYDINNLGPTCWHCNRTKGSQSLENLSKTYPHLIVDS